jgi:hypothetical protein
LWHAVKCSLGKEALKIVAVCSKYKLRLREIREDYAAMEECTIRIVIPEEIWEDHLKSIMNLWQNNAAFPSLMLRQGLCPFLRIK